MKEQYSIRSIERALDMLKCFNDNRKEIALLEFAELMSLNKSTVFRILVNLKNAGFVDINPEGKYIIGSEIIRLGGITNHNDYLKAEAHEILNTLANISEETVILVKYNNYKAICIDKIESSNDLKIVSEIGRSIPMMKGASGKIISAFLDKDKLNECIRVQQDLFNEQYDLDKLKSELEIIRKNGYCLTTSEIDQGVAAFAIPILGAGGSVIGSISIAGPNFRFNNGIINKIKDQAMGQISILSQKMGYVDI